MHNTFNPNNMNTKLREFLIKEKAFFKFVINTRNAGREITASTKYISSGFSWAESPEKYNFWGKLDKKHKGL